MKSKVIKTELGWEPAFWQEASEGFNEHGVYVAFPAGFVIEPGFAKPTKAEAQAALDRDNEESARIDAGQRHYQSGYDYACGYRD